MAPQPRVLMVEDHPDIAELYQLKLQLDGYRVALALDGVLGLQLARSLTPDLILLDLHLPRLDGLQMLSALREQEATRDLPVVVCTEDDNPQLVRESRRLGVDAYLVKAHMLPSRLSQTIADVLRHRQSREIDSGTRPAEQAS